MVIGMAMFGKLLLKQELTQYRDIYCIADHGLGVILKRKNSKILDLKNKDFKNLKFSDYYKQHKDFMNPVTYEQLKTII